MLRIYVKMFTIINTKTMGVSEMEIRESKRPWIKHKSRRTIVAPVYNEGKLIAKGEWTIIQ